MLRRFITGCKGTSLSELERQFFTRTKPCGLILFARNIQHPDQVRALVAQFKSAVGADSLLVLVDQEGGRVQRLGPPHWRLYPPAPTYGALYELNREEGLEAAWQVARLVADDLSKLGINVNCVPMLDLPIPSTHDIITDRTYAQGLLDIVVLARAVAEGHLSGGVCPVIKHIPGHGRAKVDSHVSLPVVDTGLEELNRSDFQPFRLLRGLPIAMTAHVVYSAIDATGPATTSKSVIAEIVRGKIEFEGLLLSDDLSMGALQGSMAERTRAAISADVDLVLHCNGDMAEMREVAYHVPYVEGVVRERFNHAIRSMKAAKAFDRKKAECAVARLMSLVI